MIIVAKKFIAVTTWRSDDESRSATLAAAITILSKWVSQSPVGPWDATNNLNTSQGVMPP